MKLKIFGKLLEKLPAKTACRLLGAVRNAGGFKREWHINRDGGYVISELTGEVYCYDNCHNAPRNAAGAIQFCQHNIWL